MKREICCPECGERWRNLRGTSVNTKASPFEIIEEQRERIIVVTGHAIRLLRCDGCNKMIDYGDEACAVSVLVNESPRSWERDYLELKS